MGARVLISKIHQKLRCVFVCVFVRAHVRSCLCVDFGAGGELKLCALAVRRLVVVFVLLRQRRPGLLHFLSLLCAPTSYAGINDHAELLAQVRHLICKKGSKGYDGFTRRQVVKSFTAFTV